MLFCAAGTKFCIATALHPSKEEDEFNQFTPTDVGIVELVDKLELNHECINKEDYLHKK